MRKRLINICATCLALVLTTSYLSAQCEVFDASNTPVSDPMWLACNGADFTLNVFSPNDWTSYTIDWGDGSALESGTNWTANTIIPHTYAQSVQNFDITISNPDLGCSITGVLVMEEATAAVVSPTGAAITTACAPHAIEFENSSFDVSENTVFTYDFGDGSPVLTFDHTNAGQIVSHTYEENTVDCNTNVTLTAENFCNTAQNSPSESSWGPIQIYDADDAAINASATSLCFPDNTVTFTNSTERNCYQEGNDETLAPRYEYWNFGDYWGTGQDSIIDWQIWPPIVDHEIEFPGNLGDTYTIMMVDSNFCGLDTAFIDINIVSPPTADISVADPLVCVGEAVVIQQNSIGTSDFYNYNLGNNNEWVSIPNDNDITYAYYSPGIYEIACAIGVNSSPACADTAYATVEVLPIPDVAILADNLSGCGSVTVNFAESSTDADSWSWDFGNGNTYNGNDPPAQTYSTAGEYVVTLTAENAAGCSNVAQEVVTVYNQPNVDFIATNVCEGTDAEFTDLSITDGSNPIITWDWDFGDTNSSNEQNPIHQFGPPGNYLVNLEIGTIHCTADITIPLTVEAAPIPVFGASPTNGCAPLDVEFTNNSVNSDNYIWDFGDQSGSFAVEPEHTFYNFTTTDTTYTVVLTASSNFGCFQRDSIDILVSPGAQASFTSNAQPPGCAPFTAIFTNTSYGATNYLWDFGDGTPTSTLENPNHLYNNTTGFIQTYDIEMIAYSPNGCNDTILSAITVFPEPDFTFDVTPNSGCSPLVVNLPLIPSGQSFDWDFDDGQSSTIPNPSHLYTNNGNTPIDYTITLNAVSAFGCAGTSTSVVTVFPEPEANFSITENSGCSPLTTVITDNSVGATSGTWDFGNGQTEPYSANTSHTFTNLSPIIENYNILLTVENVYSCSSQFAVPIEVVPTANAEILPAEDGCSVHNVTFINNSTNATSFQWDFGNGITSTQTNGFTSFINNSGVDTTYTVTLEAVSGLGCNDTATEEVTVYASPFANFSADVTSGCSVVSVEFTNNSTGATSYFWDYGDGEDSNTGLNNHFHDFENFTEFPIEYIVTLTVTNAIDCSDTFELPITVYPQITAEFEQEENGCSPLNVSFDNESFGSNTDFVWNFGDGTSSSSPNPTHSFINNTLNDTTFTVELITTSIYNCVDIYQQDITVFATPQADLSIDGTQGCYPLDVTFNNQSLGADTYVWAYGTGEVGNSDEPLHTHTFYNLDNLPVSYLVTLNAYSADECLSTDEVFVEVQPLLEADFNAITEGCSPLSVQFENTSSGAISNEWTFGDGSANSNLLHPAHVFENNTNDGVIYEVMLVTESYTGCTDTAIVEILVHPVPVAAFTATPVTMTFPDTEVTINNQTTGGNSVEYQWNFGDGSAISNASDPGTYDYGTWGDYTISLNVSNDFCSDYTELNVEIIPPPPVANFEGPAEGCEPLTVEFENTSDYSLNYVWDFGDGGQAFVASPVYTYQNAGTYTVRLIATGYNNGETDEIIREEIIHVYPKASAEFSVAPAQVSVPSQPVYLTNFSENATLFEWDFGDGQTSNETSPEYYYQEAGVFDILLVANNEYNCPDSLLMPQAVLATLSGNIEFPNAFTPNGETGGVYDPQSFDNNVFFPIQKGVEDYQLFIYNKWGELLFESTDVNIGWDGVYQGKLVKQDVYVWKAIMKFSDGTELTKAGDVTVLR